MTILGPQSRCCAGQPVDFYWFDGVAHPKDHAIEAASAVFEKVMQVPGRLWNPYSWAMTKSEFRKRLEVATHGGLVPVDHVKEIPRAKGEHLYEIRWDFNVLTLSPAGDRHHDDVQVRLYHSEPVAVLDSIVGLHVHEKQIVHVDRRRTNDLQNIEINTAIKRFHDGRAQRWGIL